MATWLLAEDYCMWGVIYWDNNERWDDETDFFFSFLTAHSIDGENIHI